MAEAEYWRFTVARDCQKKNTSENHSGYRLALGARGREGGSPATAATVKGLTWLAAQAKAAVDFRTAAARRGRASCKMAATLRWRFRQQLPPATRRLSPSLGGKRHLQTD